MPFLSISHSARDYITMPLLALAGALSALFCTLLVLAEAIFGFFILVGLFFFGLAAVAVDYMKKTPRHA